MITKECFFFFRHVRSASSVLDELFPLASTASESLPNLAQPEQEPNETQPRKHRHRRQFSGGTIGLMSISLSLSTSGSTSSLTSERSGWVSSHSVSEISSPEQAPATSTTTPSGPPVNGEQLRTKLYELVAGQQSNERSTRKQKHQPGYGRTSSDGPVIAEINDIINGSHVDNVDVTIALLDDDKEFIANIYGYTGHTSDDNRNNGLVKVQHNKRSVFNSFQ